ncbi:hypothetical protein SPAN111604_10860 [Sphingomonas antarctica]|uniref:PEPxxWA-CTERM sorting domain-containing protein n=1 Tax=Sphingomonas antarctica TaxID=2040274 RepID=UPI0039EB3458
MNHRLLIAAASVAIACMTSSGALAFSPDCESGGECSTPTPPPPPPPPPGVGVARAGFFFVAPGGDVLQGQTYYPNGVPTIYIFNHGPGGTVLTDTPFSQGDGTTQVTLIADAANARATAISHIGDEYGRNDVGAALYYGLSFTAGSDTVGDAVAAILAHAPLASLSGSYSLSGSGSGRALVSASSSGNNAGYSFGANCGYYYNNSPTCDANPAANPWSMSLAFTRGTEFTGGDRNTFYATFSLNASTEAGYPGGYPNTYPGDATAWIDPTVNYNSQLGQYGNSLTFNAPGGLGNGGFSFVSSGAVPEPASWALMLSGFGLLGGTMRRRRTLVTA